MDPLWARKCPVSLWRLASGITSSRGVGKSERLSVASSICCLGLAVKCPDTRGVLTSRQGTGTRTPRGRKRQKAQLIERSLGLEPGVLPLMARTLRCCQPHGFGNIIPWVNSLNPGAILLSAEGSRKIATHADARVTSKLGLLSEEMVLRM